MGSEFIVAILVSLISSITVIVSIWYKDWLAAAKLEKKGHPVSVEDKSMCYLEMDKICNTIREALSADGTYLAYFHNGGVFSNGITMDKFTVVGEDYNEHINCQYKKIYYATMINYMAYAYRRLLINSRYSASTVDEIVDLTYKSDLSKRGVNSLYMYLIKNPITDKPIGFMGVEFINAHCITKVEESDIWKNQNKLSNLLNMTVITE